MKKNVKTKVDVKLNSIINPLKNLFGFKFTPLFSEEEMKNFK